MTIRGKRFNTYLLLTLAAALAVGCQSSGEKQSKKLLATLRLHLETNSRDADKTQTIPVYREKPVWVNVEKTPFLTEANIASASVVDEVGGYVLRVEFDGDGKIFLEQRTAGNRGRRIALFSQFAPELKEDRWLAAPLINRRITDGVLVFTPDATREEADEIAQGLNEVAKKTHTWVDK